MAEGRKAGSRSSNYGKVVAAVAALAEQGHAPAEIRRRLAPVFCAESIRGAVKRLRQKGLIPLPVVAARSVLINLAHYPDTRRRLLERAEAEGVLPGQMARRALQRGLAAMEWDR